MLGLHPEELLFLWLSTPCEIFKKIEATNLEKIKPESIDYKKMRTLLVGHRTQESFYQNLKSARINLKDSFLDELSLISILNEIQRSIYLNEFDLLSSALSDGKIDHIPLKAFDLICRYGRRNRDRRFKDIDILVQTTDSQKARRIALGKHFSHSKYIRKTNSIVSLSVNSNEEKEHYELTQLTKLVEVSDQMHSLCSELSLREIVNDHFLPFYFAENKVFCIVKLDIHTNIVKNVDVDEIWKTASQFPIDSKQHRFLMKKEILICYLIGKGYGEMFKNPHIFYLRYFYDLLLVLSDGVQLEVDYILKFIREYGIEPAAFYMLGHLWKLFRLKTAKEILDSISEEQIVFHEGNYGDFMPKMLGRANLTTMCALEVV